MLVLIVDTAGSIGGVLLARVGLAGAAEVLGEGGLETRAFSTQLIPSVGKLLHDNHLAVGDVDAFAVVAGPGSFTGLRVGISAVKAMAEVTAKPVIAISRLAMMAAADFSGGTETRHAVLDAGRGEFYHGIYRDRGRTCVAESLDTLTMLRESIQDAGGAVLASEPAAADALRALPDAAVRQIPPAGVREALPLVAEMLRAESFSDVARLDANYLRRVEPKTPASAAGTADARSRV